MATPSTRKSAIPQDDPFTQDIVIERREIVGVVKHTPYGAEPAIKVAFDLATGYVAENAMTGKELSVQFRYGDHEWSVNASPLTLASDPVGDAEPY